MLEHKVINNLNNSLELKKKMLNLLKTCPKNKFSIDRKLETQARSNTNETLDLAIIFNR